MMEGRIKQGAHSPTHLLLAVGKPEELIIIIIIILNFNLLLILMVGSLEQAAGRPLLLHHSLASPLSDRTRHTQNTATNTSYSDAIAYKHAALFS